MGPITMLIFHLTLLIFYNFLDFCVTAICIQMTGTEGVYVERRRDAFKGIILQFTHKIFLKNIFNIKKIDLYIL